MAILNRVARAKAGPGGRLGVIPIIELVLLALFATLPLLLSLVWTEDDSFFWIVFTTKVLILGLFGLSFDLVWGYAGMLSFGQALFFGGSGYVVAVMSRDLEVSSIFIVLPVAVLVGLVLAVLMGAFLLIGRKPPSLIFVALGSLTGSYAAERLARAWYFLGGQNGVSVTEPLTIGEIELYEGTGFYYLALGFLVAVYIGCRFLVRSQFGLVLAGIRQHEERVTFFGYRVQMSKAIIFALGGAIAGLSGGLYAFHEGFVWPSLMGPTYSTQAVLYVLFGGVGSLIGAVVGVTAIEFATIVLADYFVHLWPIILGGLLLVVVMFRPTGLVGLLASERERIGSFRWRGGGGDPDSRDD